MALGQGSFVGVCSFQKVGLLLQSLSGFVQRFGLGGLFFYWVENECFWLRGYLPIFSVAVLEMKDSGAVQLYPSMEFYKT